MIHEIIHLKEHFTFLGQAGKDPILTTYILDNNPEIKRKDRLLPCILVCPGGGYSYVSPREAEPIALNFLPKGFNVFVLTYSTNYCSFPTQLREVAAAMELIHTNASAWGCDAGRVAIMGFSAGGHLAAHYSNCYDIPEVREVLPESKGVNASILVYPVISAAPEYRHLGSIQNLSCHDEPTAEDVEKFSLHTKITSRTPPTFLWHTAEDELVPVMNSLLYAQGLAENGVSFSLRIYPKGYHGLATADDQTCGSNMPVDATAHEWLEAAAQWLKRTI